MCPTHVPRARRPSRDAQAQARTCTNLALACIQLALAAATAHTLTSAARWRFVHTEGRIGRGTHRQRFVAHPDMEPPGNAKYPPNQRFGGYFNKSGGVLVSHSVPAAVPSALKGLTSGFGMGPGVSLSLWPPKHYGNSVDNTNDEQY